MKRDVASDKRASRTKIMAGAVAVGLVLVAGLAYASNHPIGPSGIIMNHLGAGAFVESLPFKAKPNKLAEIKIKEPVKFFHVTLEFPEQGHSGWHTHPGPVIFTVRPGSAPVAVFDEACNREVVYTAGQSFIDSGELHLYKSNGGGSIKLAAVAVLPADWQGAPFAAQPAPS
ncbi:MAG: hypothetical protein M3198_20495, partial [Actinomycetota bacterium]|nr:hypothetical protein [Actinomycetota bacterium]